MFGDFSPFFTGINPPATGSPLGGRDMGHDLGANPTPPIDVSLPENQKLDLAARTGGPQPGGAPPPGTLTRPATAPIAPMGAPAAGPTLGPQQAPLTTEPLTPGPLTIPGQRYVR